MGRKLIDRLHATRLDVALPVHGLAERVEKDPMIFTTRFKNPQVHSGRALRHAIGIAVSLLLVSSLAQASSRVSSEEIERGLELVFTTSSARNIATTLDGAGTTADGSVGIFLRSTLTKRQRRQIRQVVFSLNGRPVNVERAAPYDLGGTRRRSSATLVDKSILEPGANEVTAFIRLRRGESVEVSGTLTRLPEAPSIVDIATGDPQFSLLVEALGAAGLVDAVNGPGPITVFAPTNAAFLQLLADLGTTKEALFADTELLATVLTYHVLPGALFSPAILAADTLLPLQGEPIFVDPSVPAVNDSVLGPIDIAASNGVVHVIDRVLLPDSISNPPKNIAELAAADGRFGILLQAATEVGLDGLLSVEGPEVTLFAPTDEAFVELLGALGLSAEELLSNKPLLTTVLLYHLVNEKLLATDVLGLEEIFPMESEPITVNAGAGLLNNSELLETDLEATNGVVHVINRVLVPPAAGALLATD